MNDTAPLNLAVIGAGPVGLALALLAARQLPNACVTLWDARPLEADVSSDPRTLALSLGSIQLLQRLQAWPPDCSFQPIQTVHVSQQAPAWGRWADAEVTVCALKEGVPQLGAVLRYGQLAGQMRQQWLRACEQDGGRRLSSRFGMPVKNLKNTPGGVEVIADQVESFDLVIVAEGSVLAPRSRPTVIDTQLAAPLMHNYGQTAWVGEVALTRPHGDTAFERFTTNGPLALLPLPSTGAKHQAALVWCVRSDADPVAPLDDTQRMHLLNTLLPAAVGPVAGVSPLKSFALGLRAQRTLTQGRTVRIGNAAQTLHPVAGQGLNLGLRDAYTLVEALQRQPDLALALRQLEWSRAFDRWALLATTDFLARSFNWQLPGAATLRGMGLAALQALRPVKSVLARHMMFGHR